MITEKSSVQQVFASLMKKPALLGEVDKYNLSITDFSTRFEKYIFSAIYGLYTQGAKKIEPIDIANYLEIDAVGKQVFEKNNGVEYLQDIQVFNEVDNFGYYYNRLKKINLLRDLKKQGFNISEFYCDNLIDERAEEINGRFEELSAKDICNTIKRKLVHLEKDYVKTGEVETEDAVDGMRDLVAFLGSTVQAGSPIQGLICNKVFNGAEKQALTIRAAPSGLGKALPNSMVIATPNGDRKVGDIRPGDYVFGSDGLPTRVLAIWPQAEKKDIWTISFEDGRETQCCGDHLWSFYRRGCKELETFSTADWYAQGKERHWFGENNPRQIYAPVAQPIDYDEELPYDFEEFVMTSEKRIPIEWNYTSVPERQKLFNSFCKRYRTNRRNNKEFELKFFTNQGRALDFVRLARELGHSARFRRIPKGHFYVDVSFKQLTKIGVVNLVHTKKTTDMTCFTVAATDSLFVIAQGICTHNTRIAVADACYLAYPVHYSAAEHKWVQEGSCEKVLFIMTEQTMPQIRKMILAYLTDINESRFKLGYFTAEEEKRIDKALEVMERFRDNLVLIKMPNPSIELTKTMIREACLTRGIEHVFFDYVFINPDLLGEFRGFSLRNDELLLLFATALKDLAVELNVSMFTSTQVNANADDSRDIRNEASLAGGRSTINKADNGAIMARPTNEELEILEPLTQKYGIPNIVTDIFKVRSGEYTQVRVWSKMNLGTMKKQDLFITDSRLNPIDGFFNQDLYEVHSWDEKVYAQVLDYVKELNE